MVLQMIRDAKDAFHFAVVSSGLIVAEGKMGPATGSGDLPRDMARKQSEAKSTRQEEYRFLAETGMYRVTIPDLTAFINAKRGRNGVHADILDGSGDIAGGMDFSRCADGFTSGNKSCDWYHSVYISMNGVEIYAHGITPRKTESYWYIYWNDALAAVIEYHRDGNSWDTATIYIKEDALRDIICLMAFCTAVQFNPTERGEITRVEKAINEFDPFFIPTVCARDAAHLYLGTRQKEGEMIDAENS